MKQTLKTSCLSIVLAVFVSSFGDEMSYGPSLTSHEGGNWLASATAGGVEYNSDRVRQQHIGDQKLDSGSQGEETFEHASGRVIGDRSTTDVDHVLYDGDLEGPVSGGSLRIGRHSATFNILGMTVRADTDKTVYKNGASYEGLAEGQELKISGFFDGNQIVASLIELQSDGKDDYEIMGTVAAYDSDGVALVLQNGVIAGPYPLSNRVVLHIPPDPVGLFVEMELENRGGTVQVVHIESDSGRRPGSIGGARYSYSAVTSYHHAWLVSQKY
ncbi:MAG: DUF5666 domain-containing protein [Candidatus Thiodiazotropha sp. 6PLUC2]